MFLLEIRRRNASQLIVEGSATLLSKQRYARKKPLQAPYEDRHKIPQQKILSNGVWQKIIHMKNGVSLRSIVSPHINYSSVMY